MSWKDIIKNEPTILVEGLKNILNEALQESLTYDKKIETKMKEKMTNYHVIYQGDKRIKHNDGSINIILHIEIQIENNILSTNQMARVSFSHKSGVKFDYQIKKDNIPLYRPKDWSGGFIGHRNESINEELQRKILAVADKIPLYQTK